MSLLFICKQKYEPITEVKVQANKKNKKKKDNTNVVLLIPLVNTMFNTNVERALDIVSQDSNFAVYI